MTSELKAIVVGDDRVGKLKFILVYTTSCSFDDCVPTVFDNFSAPISINNKTILLNMWVMAGSEDLDEMRPLSYSETDCFVVCFSIADEESFERVRTKWVPEIRSNCGDENPKIVLVGTKCDLRDNPSAIETLKKQGRELVTKEMIEAMRKEVGALAACECSALTQVGLKEVFEIIAKAGLGLLDDVNDDEENVVQTNKHKKGMFAKIFGKKSKK